MAIAVAVTFGAACNKPMHNSAHGKQRQNQALRHTSADTSHMTSHALQQMQHQIGRWLMMGNWLDSRVFQLRTACIHQPSNPASPWHPMAHATNMQTPTCLSLFHQGLPPLSLFSTTSLTHPPR
uniref:Uncharacterized protein n=1 Tax=Chlamydomonas leiostraca TaxID=1034604 RepID=A0A7S0WNA4_9CHLO|mmetsp:Transcript_20187/g.51143  ORF Transcript_20187/g.51143 Transcript_20187/m.51143 type:complete len:124 (+) Transcript_20187:2-373(+)